MMRTEREVTKRARGFFGTAQRHSAVHAAIATDSGDPLGHTARCTTARLAGARGCSRTVV